MPCYNSKHMSVEIILSSKQIQLDQYNHAVLNLKALFAALPPAIVALYKVRTNSKDMVDVRPSFGVLSSRNADEAMASMQIKYMGNPQTLGRMKLQVSWVWGEGIPEKKLTHSQFSDTYASLKEKIGKEKNHMLLFTTKNSPKKGQDSLIFHDRSKTSEGSIPEGSEKEQEVMTEPNQQPSSKATCNKVAPVNLRWIIVAVVTVFLLGILVGMKIQQARDEKALQIWRWMATGKTKGYKSEEQPLQQFFEVAAPPKKEGELEDHEDSNL